MKDRSSFRPLYIMPATPVPGSAEALIETSGSIVAGWPELALAVGVILAGSFGFWAARKALKTVKF